MREIIRTIILIILLAILVGFMVWVRQQNDTNLQTEPTSHLMRSTQSNII